MNRPPSSQSSGKHLHHDIPPLLFRQTLVLLFLAGIVAFRFPVAAVTACALIVWTDSRAWRPVRLAVVILSITAGWTVGLLVEPLPPPPLPDWLTESLEKRRAVCIRGKVLSTAGVLDRRWRVILDDVHPVADDSMPLPGYLAWTWDQPQGCRPLPGQIVEISLRIRPIRSFRNEGGWDSEMYWRQRGVLFQAWSRGKDSAPKYVTTQARPGETLREKLRTAVVSAFVSGDSACYHRNREHRFPREGWILIPALLFGDRFYLTIADMERLSSAGLAHSIALSGQHLGVVGLLSVMLVAVLARLNPKIFLYIPAIRLSAIFSLPPALFYLWLGGAPPSLMRAALMLAFWVLFIWTDRPAAFPDALMAALTCMILITPLSLYDTGVQLSFAAVAGIALSAPVLHQIWNARKDPQGGASPFKRIRRSCTRLLGLILVCSVAAQIATWPLVMTAFGHSTWWFPLNLLWLPVLDFFVLPVAFVALGCLAINFTFIGNVLLHLAAYPCDLLLRGLFWLEQHCGMSPVWGMRPHWTTSLGFAALLPVFALLLTRREMVLAICRNHGKAFRLCLRYPMARLFCAALSLLLIAPCLRFLTRYETHISLRVLDVGQSQAILLEWPAEGRRGRALIDGGGFWSERFDSGRDIIAPLLTVNRETSLDFIALSHPDRDHLKGLLFFAAHFDVGIVYTTELPDTAQDGWPSALYRRFAETLALRGIPRRPLRAGERVALAPRRYPGLVLEVLAPTATQTAHGNNGLVLRLAFRGKGLALFPGDSSVAYLSRMLRVTPDEQIRAEVLVLPHHGSAGSFMPALYDAVSPEIAVASAGLYNAYRQPAPKVCAELARRNLPLHVTGEHGEFTRHWKIEALSQELPDS